MPLFEAMGKNIILEGPAGSGQHVKMANQIALAGNIAGAAEAVAYARAVGIDEKRMLETIGSGAAGSWQLTNNGAKMITGDFAPGFFIKHFVKDMKLAEGEAADRGLSLDVLKRVCDMYIDMENEGDGDLGTQALIKSYVK